MDDIYNHDGHTSRYDYLVPNAAAQRGSLGKNYHSRLLSESATILPGDAVLAFPTTANTQDKPPNELEQLSTGLSLGIENDPCF